MNAQHRRVPTLTEVVQVAPSADAEPEPGLPPDAEATVIDEGDIARRVLGDVQRQIDLMLEYRLREALAPVLARLGDTLIRELRDELASTLRDVVVRAVAQEIDRQRGR